MALCALLSLIVSLVSLVLARYLAAPGWVWALFGIAAGVGGMAVAAVGMLTGRLLPPHLRALAAAWLCAPPALLLRQPLLQYAQRSPAGPVLVDFGHILAVTMSSVLGTAVLLFGARALAVAAAQPASVRSRSLPFAGAALVVSIGLYCTAPLLRLAGLGVNHWTFLGLLGLGATAYGVQWVAARAASRRQGWRRRRP